MKMAPFLSPDGTILGHIDLDMCRKTRYAVVIDNGPEDWSKCQMLTPPDGLSPIEMYHMRLRQIKFRNRHEEVTVYHIVVEPAELPKWFWKCKAIVAFVPGSWKSVSP